MQELLPVFLGCMTGAALCRLRARRWAIGPLACVLVGAVASLINGELDSSFAALFVSFDASLVWLGAAATTGLVWSWRRVRTS
jgi:hypothetical protein